MSFEHAWALVALVLPTAIAVWTVVREGRAVTMPFDHASHRDRPWTRRAVVGAELLPAALLACAILLLAGPTRNGPPGEERVITNIEFCLDVSGSMEAGMSGGDSRYEVAMRAIESFTQERDGDAFGLTAFGGEVVRWVPLTKDLAAIRSATPFLQPNDLPPHMNSTRIGAALQFCGQTLAELEDGDRMIILVSDGQSGDISGSRGHAIGTELAASRVVVHAIHIGDGAPPSQLYDVVAPTGGTVSAAFDAASLGQVFAQIDQMQRARIRPTAPEPVDAFGPIALAGLALLGIHQLMLFGVRWTPW